MAHPPAWLCSQCGYQLGEVVRGALVVWAPKPVLGPERAGVECPRCCRPNVWHYVPMLATSAPGT